MGCFYSVFGLQLHASESIPGLDQATSSVKKIDVEVRLGTSPEVSDANAASSDTLVFASSMLTESGESALRVWSTAEATLLRLEYFDGMKFWLDREGKTVWAIWPDSSSREDAATYLLGPVLGLVLRLRGVTCLHASAVALGKCAVAFVGAEGAGKSTTAAALARRGHAVISDDIVALEERDGTFFIRPAYPYLCLWPDSVSILYGPEKALPAFSPNWDKRQLSLAQHGLRFETQRLPLGAIYLLGERSAEDAAPFLELLTPQEALLSLVAESYATSLLDKEMRSREFELLGRVLTRVAIVRLRPHQDPARVERLCDVIERDAGNRVSVPARSISQPA